MAIKGQKRVLNTRPVIGDGGIQTESFIDRSLQAGRLSLAAVGRALLADPAAWRQG